MVREFDDWRLYADATCAGLAALIPAPGVDLLFETIFRRRMPRVIAAARGIEIDPMAARRLGVKHGELFGVQGCLILPIFILKSILKRVWRKLIYVFTIKDAADQLTEYWHRAYLLDHVITAGHAASGIDIERTVAAFTESLDRTDTSGVRSIARQLIVSVSHVPRLLRRARRGTAQEETQQLEGFFEAHWQELRESLIEVAVAYNEAYARGVTKVPLDQERPLV